MTQENKELLLKNLCARLPYGIKVNIKGETQMLDSWCDDDGNYFNFLTDGPESNYDEGFTLDDIKPHLRPMSSMTETEDKEFCDLLGKLCVSTGYFPHYEDAVAVTFWLPEHHFDFDGLIDKGLAISTEEFNPYKD